VTRQCPDLQFQKQEWSARCPNSQHIRTVQPPRIEDNPRSAKLQIRMLPVNAARLTSFSRMPTLHGWIMKSGFSKIFPAACLAVLLAARSFAADTNSISAPTNADAVANGYLQIQAQLHDTQMELEKSRDEARQNAADTTARIQALEQTIAARHAADLEVAQKNQQSMFILILSGAFGLTVLAAVLFMAYLQWRSVTRLVEIASRPGTALASAGAVQQLAAPGRAAVEVSNARLLDIVGSLEKKILELESGGRLLAEPAAKPNPLAEGQAFLDANEPRKALECFENFLVAQPQNPEALVKKASALEKLDRVDEAMACCDRAIAADGAPVTAYLFKGGLLNRLQRYDEALKCYEQAMQARERKNL
jgi:tetratricopeptide (TPR) repeat protein